MKRYLLLIFLCTFTVSAQEKVKPVFENGEAQIVPAFNNPDDWIREDLWVETTFDTDGDGMPDRMHVAVTRPKQTETEDLKLPVVYESSPYFAGVAPNVEGAFHDVHHELGEQGKGIVHPSVTRVGERPIISNSKINTWVPRGYIVVHSSSPGTGLSQGSPTVGGDNESLAPKAVIDWLNGRAKGYKTPYGDEEVEAYWTTGKVGMTGTSYNGTLPLAAATTGVEGLEAIIPVAPNTSYYHYYRSNGLVRSPGGYLGEDVDVLYNFIHSGDESKRAYADSLYRDIEISQGIDRQTGDYNEFWAGRDYLNDMEPMQAALFMSHGFNDWNVMPEHSYRIYKAAEEKGLPVKIYYHQYGHGGPPPVSMMNKWFTKYLFGIDNDIEKGPKAYIVREDDDPQNPTAYANYPNPDAEDVTLYLQKDGLKKGKLSVKKPKNQGKQTFIDDRSFSADSLAQLDSSPHRLLFATPILKEDLHLSGLSTLKIKLASSKPAANLSVWMVSLPWNSNKNAKITDNIITRGWADPQNYKSLTESEPLEPGKFYELSFDLNPDDQVIPAGQQIALMIFSSDNKFTLLPEPGTELTIDLDETHIEIPVVGGKEEMEKALK
ncbi:X-Pro dipeptidyl-peptidase [Salegentibacter echinorum]|uniref:Xaa-Pro dipeptidyl-peptidase n=1 Tax=Salegentibacter echinorum TaxID=1073325 RepID=A0A1M5DP50_SALEC|nr:Xaa-Pro dipeptidyl-peptidase [Salegentibacter echinorum]SHF68676.1 X-Pro dipeptidyl-peptidase [Salegentibacter echinorum]